MPENPFAPILQAFEGGRNVNVANAQLGAKLGFEESLLERKLAAEENIQKLRLKGEAEKQQREFAAKTLDQMNQIVDNAVAKGGPAAGVQAAEKLLGANASAIRGLATMMGRPESDIIAGVRSRVFAGVEAAEQGKHAGTIEGAKAQAAAPGQVAATNLVNTGTSASAAAKEAHVTAARTAATVATTPQTEPAKLVFDQALVERQFGKDSPQAKAFAEAAAAKDAPKLTDERGMRQEFTKASGEFVAVRDAFNRVSAATQNPSPAGDLALIFNFMKMLDPSSVVREGEFATAQNAASVPDRIRNVYNKVISGERMNPDQRTDFVGQAENLFRVHLRTQRNLENQFRSLASRSKIDPANIVLDFVGGEIREAGGLPPASARPRAIAADGTPLELRDGKWVPVKNP